MVLCIEIGSKTDTLVMGEEGSEQCTHIHAQRLLHDVEHGVSRE